MPTENDDKALFRATTFDCLSLCIFVGLCYCWYVEMVDLLDLRVWSAYSGSYGGGQCICHVFSATNPGANCYSSLCRTRRFIHEFPKLLLQLVFFGWCWYMYQDALLLDNPDRPITWKKRLPAKGPRVIP